MNVLTINTGSSSLKFSLFEVESERLLLSGAVERIGLGGGRFHVKGAVEEHRDFPNHDAALDRLFEFLRGGAPELGMAGHRVVYGGRDYTRPHKVTPELITALRALIPFAPEHLPQEIKAMEAVSHLAGAWVALGDVAEARGESRKSADLYRRAAEALQDVRW